MGKVENLLSQKALAQLPNSVTPAKAGVQKCLKSLDSGFRRNDVNRLLQEAPKSFRISPRSPLGDSVLLASGQGGLARAGNLHDPDLAEQFNDGRDLALVSRYLQGVEVGAHIHHLGPEDIHDAQHFGPSLRFSPDLDESHFPVHELGVAEVEHLDDVDELVQLFDDLSQDALLEFAYLVFFFAVK